MFKIGLQMYSIRTLEGNLMDHLELAAKLGFDGVEFAGFGSYSAAEVKEKLDSLGLICMGTHTGINLLREDLPGQIAFHKEIGALSLNCPGIHPDCGEDASDEEKLAAWKALAGELDASGKAVTEAGMAFCYHNHSFEFAPIGDTCPEEIIFDNTDPAYVKVELDTCWIENTGRSSIEFMEKYKDAMHLLHAKELTAVGDPTAKVLGQGCIPFPEILEEAKKLGIGTLIIEHEGT